MRVRACLLALVAAIEAAACTPKVSPKPVSYDEELGAKPAPAPVDELAMERVVAPPGKGLRTGTIARDRLIAVLDAGPGMFLRQLEVTARLSGERFVGWQLVQLVDRGSPLYDVDLVPGDVLLAINGKPLSRPDQLQTVWDSLRTANAVSAQLWRGQTKLTLEFTVEPPVSPLPSPVAPAR
ncbi:MAG: hypothetical protein H0T89_07905 [Deltaproteobacteria bacterium]|nr:hypothetical protein [Deltaproteobacteria bacterium]MDQ3301305.1 PDZ domain-containing protein [Myxococcota bacterium]